MPGDEGIAFKGLRIAEKKNLHRDAVGGEQRCSHQAVAAVVAMTAENTDAACQGKLFTGEGGEGSSGVSHQVDGWDMKLLDSNAVAGLHFAGGEDFHGEMVLDSGADAQGNLIR